MSTYRVETRPETPSAGIVGTVTMTVIARIADRTPEVAGWIVQHGSPPAPRTSGTT